MAPLASLWARIVLVFDFLVGSPGHPHLSTHNLDLQIPVPIVVQPQALSHPIFDPPDGPEDPTFTCEYPKMGGCEACNTNEDRSCWLRCASDLGWEETYDIHTNYEENAPIGIVRDYTLELEQTPLHPDGVRVRWPQTFNGSYPGPRLQACWGDTLRITIKNNLPDGNIPGHISGNGTTIHWHGLRQWKTGWNDGVNGVTQCPIAPGDSFTYEFRVTQYGTTWYHSHYSLQYANGLLAPLTIYGPSSMNYDHQIYPLIMTDWLSNSAFVEWDKQNNNIPGAGKLSNILLNGLGQPPPIPADIEFPTPHHEVFFQQGVRYLLRLINGAIDTTFVFSIDHHSFWVISADFVPIEPYYTDHIVVGIGQRYNIIVDAVPHNVSADGNYWIRTTPGIGGCTNFASLTPSIKNSSQVIPSNTTGILRYLVNDDIPTTKIGNFDINCGDETYFRKLTPIVPWKVKIDHTTQEVEKLYLTFNQKITGFPYWPCQTAGRFQLLDQQSMWLNWSRPTLLNLDEDLSKKGWLANVTTKDTKEETWVKIMIQSGAKPKNNSTIPLPVPFTPGVHIPGNHPIHLHGHDFAVLDQCIPGALDDNTACDTDLAVLKTDNPPRRDVAFLPNGGYLILAFKADNPGVWLMHCHIAFHASLGLAIQIVENQESIHIPTKTHGALDGMCQNWYDWFPDNATDPCMTNTPNREPVQEDSGI